MSGLNITKYSTKRKNLFLSVATGHFAGSNSHSNYFIDVVSQKSCLSEARAVAKELCSDYYYDNIAVDTVVCLDGTEVIGACLADRLSKPEMTNINAQKSIYVVTPETTASGQFLFRDNIVPMIKGKKVIVLAVSVASGKTVENAIDAVRYYGGEVVGVAAIFSTDKECRDVAVNSVFDPKDLPNYQIYPAHDCPMCKAGQKVDALINSHGYSKI